MFKYRQLMPQSIDRHLAAIRALPSFYDEYVPITVGSSIAMTVDACTVHEGRCHLLAAHLRRFARSAREAGVGEMNDEALATMEALVLEVVAQGGVTHGQVRMYATSGCESENFSLCGATDSPPTYYVVAYEKDPDAWKPKNI